MKNETINSGDVVFLKTVLGRELFTVIEPYWDGTLLCKSHVDEELYCVSPWQLSKESVL